MLGYWTTALSIGAVKFQTCFHWLLWEFPFRLYYSVIIRWRELNGEIGPPAAPASSLALVQVFRHERQTSVTTTSSTGSVTTPTSVLTTNKWPSEIPAEVYSELVQAFHMIDGDGDGKIQKEELSAILTRVGSEPPSEEELELLLNEVDVNGDGCISLEEFGAISSAFGPPACDSEMRGTFDFFDADHDGKITAEELFNVFRTIGDGQCTLEDCRRMIRGVDKNGDGFVCFEDFCLMMEQQR